MIKKTIAILALATALPTAALAERDNDTWVDPSAYTQSAPERQANAEAFQSMRQQRAEEAVRYTGSINSGDVQIHPRRND